MIKIVNHIGTDVLKFENAFSDNIERHLGRFNDPTNCELNINMIKYIFGCAYSEPTTTHSLDECDECESLLSEGKMAIFYIGYGKQKLANHYIICLKNDDNDYIIMDSINGIRRLTIKRIMLSKWYKMIEKLRVVSSNCTQQLWMKTFNLSQKVPVSTTNKIYIEFYDIDTTDAMRRIDEILTRKPLSEEHSK